MLINDITQTLVNGLKRASVKNCARWSQMYRVMGPPFPGLWTFKHHPWLHEIHDPVIPRERKDGNTRKSRELRCRAKKAAQMGWTETGLNRALYHIDINHYNVLYVLPAKTPDATDFSASRFDAALELSDHLSSMFSDVKNVGHKRAGSANLYIRGSKSRAGLKSIPCPVLFFDELDEMVQKNVRLGEERSSGQEYKEDWKFSTPTVDGHGIAKEYQHSTDELYHFKCPSCGKLTCLEFPECLVVASDDLYSPKLKDSYLRCKECHNKLNHETKEEWLKCKAYGGSGIWVPKYPDRDIIGWAISQLYSMTVSPYELAVSFLMGEMGDPAAEQEFYNSKLGKEHVVDGARLTKSGIEKCIRNYSKNDPSPKGGFITMGVDTGKYLHYEIDQWTVPNGLGPDLNMSAHCKMLKEGKVASFDELGKILEENQVRCCVIDANPERRKAFEFAMKYYGRVHLCFYANGVSGRKEIQQNKGENLKISVDRTSWMDVALGRFNIERITIPKDTSNEYITLLQIPTKIYDKDKDGNPTAKYVGENDHFAHARVYSEIALPLAAAASVNSDVKAFL